jgi:hypothetical protein
MSASMTYANSPPPEGNIILALQDWNLLKDS